MAKTFSPPPSSSFIVFSSCLAILVLSMAIVGTSAARLGLPPEGAVSAASPPMALPVARAPPAQGGLHAVAFHVLLKGRAPPSAPSRKGHHVAPNFRRHLLKTSPPTTDRPRLQSELSVPSPAVGH
uniref:Uncharacterized protein n=1 Tax=Nelumbo nucifera TaxID=4432 RepID=A0A822Z455_NELNU|nr:TPA_asm: hypothetical protein HUJ06_008407 [Nelumbo nucifera]